MDIKNELLKEHSKKQTLKIVEYIGDNPKRFKQLIDIFLAGPYRVTQRAAWTLSCCVEKNHALVLPHLTVLLKVLKKDDVHDAAKRNIVRLLQFIEIPKKYYGSVVDACFTLMDPKEPVAVRVFSMTVLSNIAQYLPDLKTELQLVIEDQLPYASAGYISRAKKLLKQLKK
jgi:hypothetical protein